MNTKRILAISLALALSATLIAQPSRRENFGKGWTFSSPTSPTDLEENARRSPAFKGRTVDIPHDWGVDGDFQQAFAGETGKLPWWGKASYRKSLNVSRDDLRDRKSFFLDVDGAMSYATVLCNGEKAG